MEQMREVEQNYDAFVRQLSAILPDHVGQFALLRSKEIVGFFDTVGGAYRFAYERFGDTGYSIQEVTEESIDLGFYSHAAS